MKLVIASDHAGYDLKMSILPYLTKLGHEVLDLGTDTADLPADYPDYAIKASNAILSGRAERAILVCGSGVGISVAANKIKGIYAGVCHDAYSAHQGVEHDNMNVLCIGARIIGLEVAREIVRAFTNAQFTGEERHMRRTNKVREIENSFGSPLPMSNPPVDVQLYGQSIWYDNISRDLLQSGDLQRLVEHDGVVGVTSNPTIFEKAIGGGSAYDAQIRELVKTETPVQAIYDALSVADIQETADVLRPVFDRTNGVDGYVSLEVSPLLANDTDTTVSEAKRLSAAVNRPNLMIKIPGTPAGLPAIEEVIFAGINVNVTLLFSVENYIQVMERYIRGLERRVEAGLPVHHIASVASFFVSRIDAVVDKHLENNIRSAQGRDVNRVTMNRELLGKVAIANAKAAYRRYKEYFHGERFSRLRAAGARVQRPLWASTGTKNPAYPDTLYVDSLIGPETVNTVPPATLNAFKDHGNASPTLETGLDQAMIVLDKLAEVGINLDLITKQLQDDGVESFVDSFNKLLEGVRGKARLLHSGVIDRQELILGQYQADVNAALKTLDQDKASKHIWEKNALWWRSDAEAVASINNRLGWLTVVTDGRIDRARLKALQAESKANGWQHVVLLGMGGSSLAPEVLARVFGKYMSGAADGYPELLVLDSTDPEAILHITTHCDLSKTVFIVASKSGTTIETLSMQRYFYPMYPAAEAGSHFIAITDPGSKLQGWAKELGFAHTFLNPEDIGGRYSALSYFGLVPAALIGIDLDKLLAAAEQMQRACEPLVPTLTHPGLWLGGVMGALALQGRDKVSFVSHPDLEIFGAWAEQLIAESTGKEGKGIVPVAGATVGNPHDYGDDRLFVYLRLEGDSQNPDEAVRALQQAGHPLITYTLRDRYDIAQEFYRFEYGTAVSGQLLGINPFDEPNVTESKNNTNRLLEYFKKEGHLPAQTPTFTEDSVSFFARESLVTLLDTLRTQHAYSTESRLEGDLAAFLGLARSGEYIALMGYLAQTPENVELLSNIQRRIRHTFKRAVTVGFGPRFLHSTGQLHKGGPNSGVFVQITVADHADPAIPEAPFGFATLKQAQAAGDIEALHEHDRRAVRLHISGSIADGLRKIEEAIKAAGEKQK
jgi:transaldolase/glucose-6-phosphate isomerase